jgi:predicted acylesterase/phospholipase RssA
VTSWASTVTGSHPASDALVATCSIAYVYHAQQNNDRMAQLQVHAKIIANGAVVATTPLRSVTSNGGKVAMIGGDISLAEFAPGVA